MWTQALMNSLLISIGCVVLCLAVGIWAAYTFSRHRFLGDKHFFFWLITNRMAPAAVFVTPYFMIYTTTPSLSTQYPGSFSRTPCSTCRSRYGCSSAS